MSAPVWPAGLPQYLLRDDYAESDPENLISSDTSTGPAKVRRRSTSAVRPMSGSFYMTSSQYSAFQTFRRSVIKDGALPFMFPDPHGTGPILVRFRQVPTYAAIGIQWRVGVALEVLP